MSSAGVFSTAAAQAAAPGVPSLDPLGPFPVLQALVFLVLLALGTVLWFWGERREKKSNGHPTTIMYDSPAVLAEARAIGVEVRSLREVVVQSNRENRHQIIAELQKIVTMIEHEADKLETLARDQEQGQQAARRTTEANLTNAIRQIEVLVRDLEKAMVRIESRPGRMRS